MKHRYTALALLLLATMSVHAQAYCTPSFPLGCFNWRNITITAGSINWALGVDDCATSDYTTLSTTVNAGDDLPMTVTNGVWCGCAVWVDLDNSTSFEDSENLYYTYVGAAPSYTYNFSIAIPSGTPTGSYRMRVIAPWGSDGFLDTNVNGYGPCGSYQYGNFTDLTLNVVGSNGVNDVVPSSAFSLSPNPANGDFTISAASSIDQITVLDASGRSVLRQQVQADRITLDTQGWASGVYIVRISNASGVMSQRFVVE